MQNKNLYPFFFAAYPVLALLAYNLEEIKLQPAFRPLLIALVITPVAVYLLGRLLRSPVRAALMITLSLILFFSYGQVYNLLKPIELLGAALGRHRLMFPIWIGIWIAGMVWILRKKDLPAQLVPALNLFGAILVVLPLAQIVLFEVRVASNPEAKRPDPVQSGHLQRPTDRLPPDIYYVILDAYARDDTLLNEYKLDIRPFLEELEQIGFQVARCSQSNYAQTQLSLASSLNMNYLSELGEHFVPGNTSRLGISDLIHHSAVRQALEELGYTIVAFETGFKGTQWEDADIYLSPSGNRLDAAQLLGGMTSFEEMLIRTSAGLALLDSRAILPKVFQPGLNNPNRIHRDLILYNLEQLARMPGKSSPKLVFAHLVIPHPPYVFQANGEFVETDKPDDPGYQDQIRYLNQTLPSLLREMIQGSPTPPIIILQGDHGAIHAPPNKRMTILNAYYLPGSSPDSVPEGISPVNTFRLLFNRYFNSNYPYLENDANFSVYSRPYEFIRIPNQRPGCP